MCTNNSTSYSRFAIREITTNWGHKDQRTLYYYTVVLVDAIFPFLFFSLEEKIRIIQIQSSFLLRGVKDVSEEHVLY
jgi:hypothetical protein